MARKKLNRFLHCEWPLILVFSGLLTGCSSGVGQAQDFGKKSHQGNPSIEEEIEEASLTDRAIESKNLYFGDLHVHTSISLDAFLWGNRNGLDKAYLFARGEPIELASGATAQISAPLDFAAITDHASSFEVNTFCNAEDITADDKVRCDRFVKPSNKLFEAAMKAVRKRPIKRGLGFCAEDEDRCQQASNHTWRNMQALAKKYYVPGEFTTFAAYEFSPALLKQGKIHRNVFFRGDVVPDHAVSIYDAQTEIDLWKDLKKTCVGDCQYLTIPHNLNLTWGYAFALQTIDGDLYTDDDLKLRAESEPLVEIIQAKGSSECAVGLGAVDEECNFEQMVEPCPEGQVDACGLPTSFAREGLKIGLQLAEEKGFNPFKVGFIGSTDTHNSTPGDTEEIDYQGAVGLLDDTAEKRHSRDKPRHSGLNRTALNYNPGGLAAIWAAEDAREALFDSMKRREAYATSGTRIALRIYGGWSIDPNVVNDASAAAALYASAVPMGGDLTAREAAAPSPPQFFVWAAKDANGANLQRIQMVKGWIEQGKRFERVVDIACSDGLMPDPITQRCPDNGATVDLTSCKPNSTTGSGELKVLWADEHYKPDQHAFYYVRVLENPVCRWSTFNARRLEKEPKPQVDTLIQERAWSSPIWLQAQ